MENYSTTDLRRAFSRYPTGVTVVTTRTEEGKAVGFTANSFTSVSMSPALLLICLDKRATVHEAFLKSSGFAVNILAHDQREAAVRFASRVPDRFEDVSWESSKRGYPILSGHAAFFECLLHQAIPAGDHTIFVGQIVDMGDRDALPLAFHGGAFSQLVG